jgi:hypothetical protein
VSASLAHAVAGPRRRRDHPRRHAGLAALEELTDDLARDGVALVARLKSAMQQRFDETGLTAVTGLVASTPPCAAVHARRAEALAPRA